MVVCIQKKNYGAKLANKVENTQFVVGICALLTLILDF